MGPGAKVDLRHPYLTREHKAGPAISLNGEKSTNDCSKLLALGVMLLEISTGHPMEIIRKPEDLGANHQPNELGELNAARRWLQEEQSSGNVTFAFQSAISYCLNASWIQLHR